MREACTTNKTRVHSLFQCNCTDEHMTAGVVENLVLVTQARLWIFEGEKGVGTSQKVNDTIERV